MFLESELTYGYEFEVPSEVMDPAYLLPIGKAKIMKYGKHATIVAHSRMVKYSIMAAEELENEGISR